MDTPNLKTVLPGWEIVRLLGKGSYGAVYEIRRQVFGETESAALKVITIPQSSSEIEDLRSDGYDDRSITARFESYLKDIIREYSLMSKLKGCSNVVYCDDVKYVQHDDGFGWDIFIKMELLTPLTRALGPTVPEEQVLRIGKDLCKALVVCEEQHVLHRDIKPQNIFVARDGTCKLGDFGVAKAVERTSGGTKTGTYKYMAPEVFNNRPYGSKADQYSLGLVLYWLLNERRTPFLPPPPAVPGAAEEDRAKARRFAGEPIPAPLHGSEGLKRIVLKALACDPAGRYPDAAGMLRALEALERGAVPPQPSAVPRENADATVGVFHTDPSPRSETPARADADATVGVFRPEAPKLASASAQPVSSPVPRAKSAQTFVPPSSEEATPTKKNKRGLVFGLCGALALGLILLLILLPGKKGSPSAAPAGTEPPVVMETINPEVTPEPTSESTPETTPEPTPEPIAEPPEEPVQSPEELLAQGFSESNDGLFWKLEDGVLTIAGQGEMTSTPWIWNKEEIQSVCVLNGVTSIRESAFMGLDSLTSVTIPSSVTSIGKEAFYNCKSLSIVTIPAGVTSIGDKAFYQCTSLSSVTIPAGVTSIGDKAFCQCKSLTSITIPDGVASIGSATFAGCENLTSVTIPDGVASIGSEAFSGCTSLTSVNIPSSVATIDSMAFFGCKSLPAVTIPDGVASIGESAFMNCESLTAMTIPGSVVSIGDQAFWNCESLSDLSISDGTASIGKEAFRYCDSLTSLTIPGSVVSMGEKAFSSCDGLESLIILDGVTAIGRNAFSSCYSLKSVTLPNSVTTIGVYAFSSCKNLTSVNIPNSVATIDSMAFFGCKSLPAVTIPEGVVSIGDGAFDNCDSLTSVTIPASVTTMEHNAFAACHKLTSIAVADGNPAFLSVEGVLFSKDMKTLIGYPAGKSDASYSVPAGVAVIANYAFYSCDYLTSVTLPAGVTEIGDLAFCTCRKLSSLKIPVSVVSIGEKAFGGLTELKEIRYAGTVAQWKAISFGKEWYGTTYPTIVYNAS